MNQKRLINAGEEYINMKFIKANEDFTMDEDKLLDIIRRNQPIRNVGDVMKAEGWDENEDIDIPIQKLIKDGKVKYEWGYGYIANESKASEYDTDDNYGYPEFIAVSGKEDRIPDEGFDNLEEAKVRADKIGGFVYQMINGEGVVSLLFQQLS